MMALQLLLFAPTIINAYRLRFFYYYPVDGRSIFSYEISGVKEYSCQSRDVRVDWLKFKNENSSFELAGYLPSNCTGAPLFVITETTRYFQTPTQWDSFSIRAIKASE